MREFIPVSIEPFRHKFRIQLDEGLFLQAKLYNRNTDEGWQFKIIYFCKNFRKKTKSIELDLYGLKQSEIQDRNRIREFTEALHFVLEHRKQTIFYDEYDGCLLIILRDPTVETMPWCMIRFEGLKQGTPVYSGKKLAFSAIPDGVSISKDFYVFWSEVGG